VRSALNQTLPRDLYEVIVVKNFRDEAIDRELQERGVVNLYSNDVTVGGTVHEALEVARGDVVSLLDDDDEFLPEKLERVYAAFRTGIDYYHNGRVVVNEAGKVLRKEGHRALIKGDEEKVRYALQIAIAQLMHFNNSSISVRKSVLKKDWVKNCDLPFDVFAFTAALFSARVMVDDPIPLTLFRVHSQHLGADLNSFDGNLAAELRATLRRVSDFAYLLSVVRGTPYERVVKYFYLDQKLAFWGLPERPQLGSPGVGVLSAGDVIEWASFLPYFQHHLRFFIFRSLTPALPKAARRAVAKFTFDLEVRQALG